MSSGLFRPIHLALGEMREKCSKTMSKLPYLPNTLCRLVAHGAVQRMEQRRGGKQVCGAG